MPETTKKVDILLKFCTFGSKFSLMSRNKIQQIDRWRIQTPTLAMFYSHFIPKCNIFRAMSILSHTGGGDSGHSWFFLKDDRSHIEFIEFQQSWWIGKIAGLDTIYTTAFNLSKNQNSAWHLLPAFVYTGISVGREKGRHFLISQLMGSCRNADSKELKIPSTYHWNIRRSNNSYYRRYFIEACYYTSHCWTKFLFVVSERV